jgi:peptidylprolyl isomerase
MALAKNGDKVLINYTGTLADGTIIDSTLEDVECCDDDCGSDDCGCEAGPMELTIGEEEFFPQVETALIGMAPGEKKKVVIPSADAFGEYDEEEVFTINKSQLTSDAPPEIGQELELSGDDEDTIVVTIVDIKEDTITVDANHPLAGEDITYEIELLEIR